MQTNPFKRAMLMATAISAILSNQTIPASMRQFAINELGTYKSRGHGKGLLGRNYNRPSQTDWHTRQPKFKRGSGKRECARRLRQMAKRVS